VVIEAGKGGGKGKYEWTPAMRAAQAERLRKRWAAGEFDERRGKIAKRTPAKRAATKPKLDSLGRRNRVGKSWTPEQRAKFSKTMKAVYARKAKAAATSPKSASE
jgi:hypothetical protein